MADHSENSKPKMASPPVGSLIRVYAHGIYDLFNSGHAASLEQAKKSFPNTFLVVGCCNDEVAHKYKGKPVMTAAERYESLRHCKWVDEVIPDAPWAIDLEFLDKHYIDYLAHDPLPLVRERERMADHSENSKPKMASPPVDRPYADFNYFGSASYFEEAKKLWDRVIPDARSVLGHVAGKMDKLFDSDDKKEEDVLPCLSFHATEEECQAFFSVRKEGKTSRLVELIKENTDIYKYGPWNFLNYAFQENSISLKCVDDDDVVLKMNKRAATSQSGFLKDVVDSTGGRDEIPVPRVTSLILSKIASFCKKKHKFDTQLNIIAELLKSTMDSYKAFVTSFVKDNHSIFSQLHDAAYYLEIPNLMELMSCTMRDMEKGSTMEDRLDRHSTLAMARILSPLGLSLKYSC